MRISDSHTERQRQHERRRLHDQLGLTYKGQVRDTPTWVSLAAGGFIAAVAAGSSWASGIGGFILWFAAGAGMVHAVLSGRSKSHAQRVASAWEELIHGRGAAGVEITDVEHHTDGSLELAYRHGEEPAFGALRGLTGSLEAAAGLRQGSVSAEPGLVASEGRLWVASWARPVDRTSKDA